MKRLFLLSMIVLLAAVPALAENTYLGTMMVDNCESWVSLRDGPGTGCRRLAKVPLYAIVTDAEQGPFTGDFTYCNYDGQYGYIMSKYLVPWADPEPEDGFALDVTLEGYRVTAKKSYEDGGECLRVSCEDASGERLWSYETSTGSVAELDATEAFIGGPAQDPVVMVYNALESLTALDVATGEVRWTLAGAELGGGITHAVDGEGNAYIGGYYGPDPVCIDKDGQVRWRSDSGGCYWLYNMEIVNGEIVCTYDVMDGDHDRPGGRVVFGMDGQLLRKEYE